MDAKNDIRSLVFVGLGDCGKEERGEAGKEEMKKMEMGMEGGFEGEGECCREKGGEGGDWRQRCFFRLVLLSFCFSVL